MNRLGRSMVLLALLVFVVAPRIARGQDGTAPASSATNGVAPSTTASTTYTAKKGQTLAVVAKVLGVALDLLARANPQIRSVAGVLLPGDVINVPPVSSTPPFVPPPVLPAPVATTLLDVPSTPTTQSLPPPPALTSSRTDARPTNVQRGATAATAEEREVMARIVKGETCPGCPREGQVAIAAVILNRVKSGNTREYGSGIVGVCQKKWQFSCYNADQRSKLYDGPIPARAFEAVDAALAGENPIGTATHYFNPYFANPAWKDRLVFVCQIGEGKAHRHDFYRYKDK